MQHSVCEVLGLPMRVERNVMGGLLAIIAIGFVAMLSAFSKLALSEDMAGGSLQLREYPARALLSPTITHGESGVRIRILRNGKDPAAHR